LGVEPKRISDAALAWLAKFDFPGNVRQLENICHWVTVMAPAQVIEPKDLPPEVGVVAGQTGESRAPISDSFGDLPHITSPGRVDLEGEDAKNQEMPLPVLTPSIAVGGWERGLEADAISLLASGRHDVWDELTRRFESTLILAALAATRGRRIDAAQKLGIGRNTITRKIQDLGLE
jgi:two-component system nitrogen regulation response regulator GlnG